jgi:hypothetical protein
MLSPGARMVSLLLYNSLLVLPIIIGQLIKFYRTSLHDVESMDSPPTLYFLFLFTIFLWQLNIPIYFQNEYIYLDLWGSGN